VAISRRHALRTLAAGAAASPFWVESLTALSRQQAHDHAAQAVITAKKWTPRVLNAKQNELVVTISELIIPQTGTPGAKAARVNRFIDTVLQDAKTDERDKFLRGLAWIDQRSKTLFAKDFASTSADQQSALLTRLSAEGNPDKEEPIGRDFFQAIKSMTINGYYTSEIGLQQELGDDPRMFLTQFVGCTHPEHQP
jgi:glucoside 3-dehydrogenase (cytochrome c) hitch-hiker subunit